MNESDEQRQSTGADLEGAFRGALGRFASGVTVLTTVHGGVDHAMTASAFCSVSLDPRLVLVCVDRRNRIHEAVGASKSWAVSMLREEGHAAASWLAFRGRPLEGQLDRFPQHRGDVTGAVLLDDALAWLECRTWESYDGGDHTILVGEVVSARVRNDDEAEDPLLYYRSHYGSLIGSPGSEKSEPRTVDARP